MAMTKKKPVSFVFGYIWKLPIVPSARSDICCLQKLNNFANFTTCTYTHIHGILWEVNLNLLPRVIVIIIHPFTNYKIKKYCSRI